jgi:hypothetical protein
MAQLLLLEPRPLPPLLRLLPLLPPRLAAPLLLDRLLVLRPVVEREELEREEVDEPDREDVERFVVAREVVERPVLDRFPWAAFASSFCAWSNSRWRALPSLLLSRRAFVTNVRRSV